MKITDRFLKEGGAAFVILSSKNLLFAQNKFLAMKFNPFLGGGILSGLQVVKKILVKRFWVKFETRKIWAKLILAISSCGKIYVG